MKLTRFKIILCFVFAFFMSSCSNLYHYFPNHQALPLYKEKSEIHIDGSIGGIQHAAIVFIPFHSIPICLNGYLGYSFSNHLYADIQISSFNHQKENSGEISGIGTSVGMGYYNWLGKFTYGAKMNFSFGKTNINAAYGSRFDLKELLSFTNKQRAVSIIPFIGIEHENSQILLSLNCSNIYYFDIKNKFSESVYDDDYLKFMSINDDFSTSFIEPSITLKTGSKRFKLVFQEVISYPINPKKINYMKYNSYIGVEFNLKIDEISSFIKSSNY